MAIVAGVDFGTLSVRVSIVDSRRGMLASAVSEYPLHRQKNIPPIMPPNRTMTTCARWHSLRVRP